MGTVKRFEDLEVWKEARNLVKSIYECASKVPFSKDLGLKDQIQNSNNLYHLDYCNCGLEISN